jgi:hypothetical protein
MQYATRADPALVVYRHIRMQQRIVTYAGTIPDKATSADMCAATYAYPLADDRTRADAGGFFDMRAFVDYRRLVHARRG